MDKVQDIGMSAAIEVVQKLTAERIAKAKNESLTANAGSSLQDCLDAMHDAMAGHLSFDNAWDGVISLIEADEDGFVKEIDKRVGELMLEHDEYGDDTTTDEEGEAMTKTEEVTKFEVKNTDVMPAINALLSTALGGDVTMEKLIGIANDGAAKVAGLEATIAKLKSAKPVAVAATKGEVVVNGDELTYEVVDMPADELFAQKDSAGRARKSKALGFTVPTLVWKDDKGNVVEHPMTPSVDEEYQFSPIQLVKFLRGSLVGKNNTWLFGHSGTGKTTFVEQVAARTGFPVSRVNLDSELSRADFVGAVALIEENGASVTKFIEGVLPKAMAMPCYFLTDEIDAARPDIMYTLQRMAEGNGLMLNEDSGRIIHEHELFRFVATANTRGQGDEYGIYQGTKALSAALLDRFPIFLEFSYLKKAAEKKLLEAKVPMLDGDVSEQIVSFANEFRTAFYNGELFQTITPRSLMVLGQMYVDFQDIGISKKEDAMQIALESTVFDKTTKDTVQKVKELADRCINVKTAA